jgi:predicted polyphosphate/ATP-dependent NAD kinase
VGIDVLVVIGGDGTFEAYYSPEFNFPVMEFLEQ